MGKRKETLEEQELDFHEEQHHMAAPGFSSGRDSMKQRNSAISIIQKLSKSMSLDAIVGFRALLIYDRYASRNTVQAEELERVAISCFTISLRTMDGRDFPRMLRSNRNLITEEIKRTEDRIVRRCRYWDMRGPNSLTFLNYFVDNFFADLTYTVPLEEIRKLIVKFQKDKKSTRFKPSVITAAAILKITSKQEMVGTLTYGCCKQQFFGEGVMEGNEGKILDCESAMEKWYLLMVGRGEISLENWVSDIYEPMEESLASAESTSSSKTLASSATSKGKGKDGEVSGDDSSSQVKHYSVDIHEERQGGPSISSNQQLPLPSSLSSSSSSSYPSTDKGKEGEVLDEWDSKMLEEDEVSEDDSSSHVKPHTVYIHVEESQGGGQSTSSNKKLLSLSSTDRGKGKEMLDKRGCRIVEIREECHPGPSFTEEAINYEEQFRFLLKMLKEGELSRESFVDIMTAYKRSSSASTDKGKVEAGPCTPTNKQMLSLSSTDKGKGKEVLAKRQRGAVEIHEVLRADLSSTEVMKEEHFRFILKMLNEGDLSRELAMQLLTPPVKQPPLTTRDKTDDEAIEKARYRLLGFELNWDDEEIAEDTEETGWEKMKKWMTMNAKRLTEQLKVLKENHS